LPYPVASIEKYWYFSQHNRFPGRNSKKVFPRLMPIMLLLTQAAWCRPVFLNWYGALASNIPGSRLIEKRIYRAAASQRLRTTGVDYNFAIEFEVLIAVGVKNYILWDITLCGALKAS
jgi:hypothetical protein